MAKQPLAEVFGFPVDNHTPEAVRYRRNRLCRFGNVVPNCTKDKANNPLGVCSVHDGCDLVITCPIRFRERWVIAEDAAGFMFPPTASWTTLTEVRLKDSQGASAGNIDVVLCSYDDNGKITDFGALEVQAVYISGNVRNPFDYYMETPTKRACMDWSSRPNYPKPDYLSSSRKRLAPQLLFKGGIFKSWNKKTVVALNRGFFGTLPKLERVEPSDADMAWFIYDLVKDKQSNLYVLQRCDAVYSRFQDSLQKITRSEAGDISTFLQRLQDKVNKKLNNTNPPDTEKICAPF